MSVSTRHLGLVVAAAAAATAIHALVQAKSGTATATTKLKQSKQAKHGKKKDKKKGKKHKRVHSGDGTSSIDDDDDDDLDSDGSNDSSDSDGPKDKDKKWEERHETWSGSSGQWQVRAKDDSDSGYIFVVKHRTYPKSNDYDGREDYTAIELRSDHLQEVLSQCLPSADELYDSPPEVNANDIYLALDKLERALERLKVEKDHSDDAEEEGTDSKEGGSEQGGDEEQANETSATSIDAKADDGKEGTSELTPAKRRRTKAEHLEILLTFCRKHFEPLRTKLEKLVANGQITYKLLWAILPINSIVVTTHETTDEPLAFKLKTATYCNTRDGPALWMEGIKIVWTGTKFTKQWVTHQVSKVIISIWPISTLATRPITEKLKQDLLERGRRYKSLCRVAFMTYRGVLVQVSGSGMTRKVTKLRADGRAVIDAQSFRRVKPSLAIAEQHWRDDDYDDEPPEGEEARESDDVLGDELVLLPPTVHGFSLVQREWGEMLVDGFSDVSFNPHAWDTLVLERESKELIRSLVEQNSADARRLAGVAAHHRHDHQASIQSRVREATDGKDVASEERQAVKANGLVDAAAGMGSGKEDGYKHDVIEGKGGGLVIVLHGRPGTGKTLTAEAIAELIKVPLYSVAAGELGVAAEELERRLRDILDVARSWGAVVLIDEADVFLEERQKCDISRNAMVSVFLRCLEYHSGILILTTNRIRAVDQAFLSRFSFAVTYPSLDADKRLAIWKTFINRAGASIARSDTSKPKDRTMTNGATSVTVSAVSETYLAKLAQKRFNGRAIKNIARTAVALAKSRDEPFGERHLDVVVKVSERFETDFKEADESGVYDAPGEGWKDNQLLYH